MSNIKDSKTYSLNDLIQWYENGELVLSPKYQRNKVWNHSAKSYLIDSILRGFPIPQLFIRQSTDVNTRKTTREIIDGQQRTSSIIGFINNEFPILKAHNSELAGMYYKDLSDDYKEAYINFQICVEIIKIKDDGRIYEMFARLNTNNMTLNKQELRNAKYWGEFKAFIYKKSSIYRSFFMENRLFSEGDYTRMLDIEFFNYLVINIISGVTSDTPKSVDNYYHKYDKEFHELEVIDSKLSKILDVLNAIYSNTRFITKIFRRKNYFFTLFCTLNHLMYNKIENIQSIEEFNLDNIERNTDLLIARLSSFESDFLLYTDPSDSINEENNASFLVFEKNHSTRTTNKDERTERISFLVNHIAQ